MRQRLAVAIMCTALLCIGAQLMAMVIPNDAQYVRSLDGTWRFKLEQSGGTDSAKRTLGEKDPVTTPATFEPFFKLDYNEKNGWHDLAIPCNWEMARFSLATYNNPDNASGFYRVWVDVPAEWQGREVKINFDGVMCGTEIWLNGEPVNVTEPSWGRTNYHESGWTAWQADLTPQVKFGQKNLLALRVTKNTKSSDLDSGDYFFLGGVYRPVTLFSVPKTHIEDVTITTPLLPGGKAEVRVKVAVAGASGTSQMVTARLGDFKPVSTMADAKGSAEMVQTVETPRLWSAEHPNLYPLIIELKDFRGQVIEKISRKVGIRQITIEKGVFKVNGVPVKMAGMCRHDCYLPVGTAVGPDLWKKDLTLMKAANINAVRTSHYPYGSGFYDMCDEMGFYVIGELPYCWVPTNDAETTPAFLQRAREEIARDKNHPCIVVWAVGNENGPGINQKLTADEVRRLDPTRPRLNSCRTAEENGVEFDDLHYTTPETMAKQAVAKQRETCPLIYTENPNVWDVRFGADYGCLDRWGAVLQRCWDVTWKSDGICGGFMWEWQDRAVCDKFPTKAYQYDPATGVQYVKTKGVVDGWRNPRPEYYSIKMVYSPIQVEGVDLASKPGYAILTITNHYSFTDLAELNTKWTLLRGDKIVKSGMAHPKLAPMTSGKVEIKLTGNGAKNPATEFRLDFDHGDGRNIISHQVSLAQQNLPAMGKALPEGLKFPKLNLVRNETTGDSYAWRKIARYRGRLINVKTDPAITGDVLDKPLAEIRSLGADVVLDNDANTVVGHVHAECTDGNFSYKVDWTGKKSDIQELGWTFDMPKQYDHFSWNHETMWTVYPKDHIGRPAGTALPDTANVHLTNISRPDAFDFNSTKYDCNWASLTDAKGHGLQVQFSADGRHHVKGGFGEDGTYQLIVNKQCSPPKDISTNVVPDFMLELQPGNTVEGSFRIGSE